MKENKSEKQSGLTHQDIEGRVKMVDVSRKDSTLRVATAFSSMFAGEKAFSLLKSGELAKGDAWAASRVAAIMAAKKTSEFIPLTHPIRLDSVRVDLFPFGKDRIGCFATACAFDRTGVEMEAMVAASVAALTIYDMLKGIERGIVIEAVRLEMKDGGRSGRWER